LNTSTSEVIWPERCSLFGVGVSATDYNQATSCIINAAKQHLSSCIDAMPVHGLMTAVDNKEFNAAIKKFDMVCPDGQPVRWALNKFHNAGLTDRVLVGLLLRFKAAGA
jgi:N-acetylglucosaminyldiphosphoundecaprenol N-acetyl-beta-D-mannosaminyltransferase